MIATIQETSWVEILGRTAIKRNKKKNHLELRGAVWYVRWDVPADVRHAFNNQRIMKKALSSNKPDAQLKSLELLHAWKTLTTQVRTGEYDPEKNLKTALLEVKAAYKSSEEDIALTVVRTADAVRNQFSDNNTAEALLEEWQSAHATIEEHVHSLYRQNILNSVVNIINFIRVHIGTLLTTPELHQFMELELGYRKELQLAFIHDKIDTSLSYQEIRQLSQQLKVTKDDTLRHGVSDSALNSWKAALVDQHKREKTINDYFSKLKKFQSYLNNNHKGFTFITVAEFIKSTSTMRRTQESYVAAIGGFWRWALKYQPAFAKIHDGKPNPSREHQFPKHGDGKGQSYQAFKKEDVHKLFNASLSKKQPDVELACLICYGVYTGARLEEIGRINAANTTYMDNEPVAFKIEDAKTNAGIREIPIHSDLKSLHKLLLELKPSANSIFDTKKTVRGTQMDHMSKRFGRLKTEIGFEKLQVFHSLRKTFTTELYEHKVRHELIQRLVGHAGDNVTVQVYLDDYTLQSKIEAVETINIGLDICHLLEILKDRKT